MRNDIPFVWKLLAPGDNAVMAELAAHWPLRKFPVLVDGERPVREASIIIEYLAIHYPGAVSLIPADAAQALEVRFMDRFFDNYVSTPQQRVVVDTLRGDGQRDPAGVADARQVLDTAYGRLEGRDAFAHLGGGGGVFDGGLRGGAGTVLRPLDAPDTGPLRGGPCLPATPSGAAVLCPGGGRGAALSPSVSVADTCRGGVKYPPAHGAGERTLRCRDGTFSRAAFPSGISAVSFSLFPCSSIFTPGTGDQC